MNKVVNSVQQILQECDKMFEHTQNCEFIDVKGQVSNVKEKYKKLSELYNNSPEKEREILMAKADTENAAIRLEFYMDVRLGLYKERRKLRRFAETLYNDVKDACTYIGMHGDTTGNTTGKKYSKQEVVEWASYAKWVMEFYVRSKHIIFDTDEDDDKMITKITEELKKFKESV